MVRPGTAAFADAGAVLTFDRRIDHIHRGSHGEFVEQAGGDGIAALRVGQGQQDWIVAGLALLGAVQGIEPGVEFEAAFFEAESGVVGNVVAAPHEGIDGAQRLPLALRQHQKCVVEILGVGAGDAAAHGVRHGELRRSGSPRNEYLLRSCAHGGSRLPASGLRIHWLQATCPARPAPPGRACAAWKLRGGGRARQSCWRSMAFRIS